MSLRRKDPPPPSRDHPRVDIVGMNLHPGRSIWLDMDQKGGESYGDKTLTLGPEVNSHRIHKGLNTVFIQYFIPKMLIT